MIVNLPNIAKTLESMGYKAKYVSGRNQSSGEQYDLVEIGTGRRVDAVLKETKGKLAFEVYGRFPEGHNGLDAEGLKKFNNRQAAMVRAKIEGPVMAAVCQELAGGTFDLKDVDAVFRISGRTITEARAEEDHDQDEPKAPIVGGGAQGSNERVRSRHAPGMGQ